MDTCPLALAELADRRTRAFLDAFPGWVSREQNNIPFRSDGQPVRAFALLLRSCYLQGVIDGGLAMEQKT